MRLHRRHFMSLLPLPLLAASTSGAKEKFLRLIARSAAPLASESKLIQQDDALEQHRFTYAADALQRVPGVIVKPRAAKGRLPVVIALHGTGGNKEGQLPLLRRLAGEGFLAIAIDGRYHGERCRAGSGSVDYADAMLRAYRGSGEHPFLYDTVWDLMRLIDWLATRDDVDAARIGAIGFSKGGMELYLAAAVDPRIRCAVPCIGVQSFRWALEHDAWQSRAGTFQSALNAAAHDEGAKVDAAFLRRFYDRVAPGVHAEFDGPQMVPLIAPRPLLMINGDSDARTPRQGLMECVDAATQAYSQSPNRFRLLLQPNTGHKVNPEALDVAVEWLVRHSGPRS